jgi:thimet oligopeptidase
MEHRDVVTFFHEFGHLIHQLLARESRWIGVAGIETEWDFVEAPSQLLEEWAWDAEVLRGFARHVDSGEPIPESLVTAMRDAEELGRGVDLLRQVYLSAYSFELHVEDPGTLDLEAFTARMYKTYAPFPKPEVDHLHANFGHLMGYSAIYYTYQWSLAIAKDLFTRFSKAGIMNTRVAREYAAKILEPGGTRPADAMIRDFLGRPRNLDAYRAWITRGR